MNIDKIIKNPIIIGLVAGLLTYIYLKWKNDKNNEEISDIEIDEETDEPKKPKKQSKVNLLIPLAVAIVFWFISYAYFFSNDDNNDNISDGNGNGETIVIKSNNDIVGGNDVFSEKSDSFQKTTSPSSFSLVQDGGIQIPNKLPDILFEME